LNEPEPETQTPSTTSYVSLAKECRAGGRSRARGPDRSHGGAALRSLALRRCCATCCDCRPRRPCAHHARPGAAPDREASRRKEHFERDRLVRRGTVVGRQHQPQRVDHVLTCLRPRPPLADRARHLDHLRHDPALLVGLFERDRQTEPLTHSHTIARGTPEDRAWSTGNAGRPSLSPTLSTTLRLTGTGRRSGLGSSRSGR
jgi:hypothetical protein